MMRAGVRLRQDTETTLPELPEQHRIREKEELHELESVHMAESETKCTSPGLNTLEPECVTANSRVSDLHHTEASLIKTETDLGPSNTGDTVKMEILDIAELEYLTHLHPDQIKTETDEGGYFKVECMNDLEDTHTACDGIKLESGDIFVRDLMDTVITAAGVNHKDHTNPCAGEPNPYCKNEKNPDLATNCGSLAEHDEKCCGNGLSAVIQNQAQGRRLTVVIEPLIINRGRSSRPLNSIRKKPILRNKGKIQANERQYKHTRCDERCYGSKSGLNRHLKIHSSEKLSKCPLGEKCFPKKSKFTKLVTNTGAMPSVFPHRIYSGERTYKCIQCKEVFSEEYDLSLHQRIHTSERPHRCSYCTKSFVRKHDLHAHRRIHTGAKPYRCSHCTKSFSRKNVFDSHRSVHTGEKPYKCTECKKCFSRKCNLTRHQKVHTGEKSHKCSHCGKCFSEKFKLTIHQRTHSGEKPFKCSVCGKCFSQKCSLSLHQRIHTGEKPYKCSQCGMCFARKISLDTHGRVHTGDEKPYKCIQCEKCFPDKYKLSMHQIIHSGVKPYKCSQCEKCFSQKGNVSVHLRVHTGEKPYKCSHCWKSFSRKFSLVSHRMVHTSNE